jgi:outer membrane protein assembly factor BamA
MRLAHARYLGRAPAALLLLLAASAFGQEAAVPAPAAESTELERSGATIRAINVTVDNVFDPDTNPEEDKRLYRWANKVHFRTRPQVIESILLFKIGDKYQARLLDESARTLRARGFLSEARLTPRAYDPATNTVEVDVRVRDSWSLAPDLKLSRSGGENEWALGMSDGNLFGTGKSLTVRYSSDVDRDETLLAYGDANVFNSRVRLGATLAHASDGHRRSIGAERPFYSLDTRWALGGTVRNDSRVDTIYDLGEEIDEFRHDIESVSLQGGLSRGLVNNRAQRWLFGFASEEDRFVPTLETPAPLLLPQDRKLVYPWLGWQLVEDDFREMSELEDMGRTEDISLGLNLYFSVGFAERRFGSDRDATLFRSTAQKGWEPGGSGKLLLFNAGGSTRSEDDGLANSIMYASAKYYRRNLEKHLFSVSLSALTSNKLDFDQQVLLGGDNGLRGYPLRYQAGKHRAILTVEQRFFTDYYPWRLLRMGFAAFLDAGRVEGRDPRATPSQGTLYDVGFGLRLTSPRSSGRSVAHVDLAFPLNGDSSIDKVQLLFETKASF